MLLLQAWSEGGAGNNIHIELQLLGFTTTLEVLMKPSS